MQTFLRLLLFSAFVTTGVSLECETCAHHGSSCSGKTKACAAGQNTCIISLVESSLLADPLTAIPKDYKNPEVHSRMDESKWLQVPIPQLLGRTIQLIEKGCEIIPICKFGDVHLSIGNNRTLKTSTLCCKGAACQNVSIKLPPIHTLPNGKQCPACFTVSHKCPNAIVECVGPENLCFEVNINAKIGYHGIPLKAIVKGCTTKSFCDIFQTGNKMYRGLGLEVEKPRCNATTSGPGPSGFSYPVLLGPLLMKVLV